MSRNKFNLDERTVKTILKICAILYFITIYSLIGVMSYRQYILHQAVRQFEDIAIIVTFNVLVMIGSALYFVGGVTIKKTKLRWIIPGYVGFVLMGFAFTIFRYTVLLDQKLGLNQVVGYFFTVLKVTGLLVIVWCLLAYLGNRRIEKQIE
ncbi:hypothetical protein ACFL6S_05510 [Candidatus Poribacteria bacterium]